MPGQHQPELPAGEGSPRPETRPVRLFICHSSFKVLQANSLKYPMTLWELQTRANLCVKRVSLDLMWSETFLSHKRPCNIASILGLGALLFALFSMRFLVHKGPQHGSARPFLRLRRGPPSFSPASCWSEVSGQGLLYCALRVLYLILTGYMTITRKLPCKLNMVFIHQAEQ
jgi:hypothetical protein